MEKQIHGFVGQTAVCLKCGKEFEPVRVKQQFCSPACRVDYHNQLKKSGIHLIPQLYNYIKSIAESQIPPVSVDEMANRMFLKFTGHEEEELKKSERPGEYLKTIEGINE